jgi:hypothetical protein
VEVYDQPPVTVSVRSRGKLRASYAARHVNLCRVTEQMMTITASSPPPEGSQALDPVKLGAHGARPRSRDQP